MRGDLKISEPLEELIANLLDVLKGQKEAIRLIAETVD
jgi:hypothetical protein